MRRPMLVLEALLVLALLVMVCGSPPTAWSQPADIDKEAADYDRQIQQKRDFLTGKEQNKKQLDEDVLKTEAALAETQRRLQPLTAELETLKVKTQKAKK
ncbi:MAG: hypothetical protein HY914_05920, partial [Desulfomonile tiedjei]|nr:hypothetical protein [Desulfomonile tiedjei]